MNANFVESLLEVLDLLEQKYHEFGLSNLRQQSRLKADGSPVTPLDLFAEEKLAPLLQKAVPNSIYISEEMRKLPSPEEVRNELTKSSQTGVWLVDPLDGTKDLLAGETSFAVSIGYLKLDSNRKLQPVWGFIGSPLYEGGTAWAGGIHSELNGIERYMKNKRGWQTEVVAVSADRTVARKTQKILASRSVPSSRWLQLHDALGSPAVERLGSAIKFARIACGEADLYFRKGPTSEWDMAAGQALVEKMNGVVWNTEGAQMEYLKPLWLNSGFVVAQTRAFAQEFQEIANTQLKS